MLQPKKMKFRKTRKGRNPGVATRGNYVAFGDYGLQSLDNERITARHGEVLQLRPKAANSKALTEAIGEFGQPILTLPRGFYLKKRFTGALLARHFLL